MSRTFVFAFGIVVCSATALVHAQILSSNSFDDDFTITGGASGHSLTATGGQLVIAGNGVNEVSTFLLPGPGAATPFSVSTQVGTTGSPGSFNVGLQVGSNNVVFHPGFGGGAFRVEGAGGFGNQNMGFTPPINALHTLTVMGDGAGNFTAQLVDGTNGANIHNAVWSNAGNTLSSIGVRRSGPTGTTAIYDNLSVPPSPLGGFTTNFSSQADGTIAASGGVLTMQGAGTNTLTFDGHAGNLLISADIGNSPGSGNTNVGLRVGGNDIVFHPTFAPIPGAFRVEGAGGFGNQDMGFIPAGVILHNMEVAVDAATGRFTIAVADANNPDNVYAARFTNGGYSPGTDQIGFKYGSGTGGDQGQFDNLVVSQLQQSATGNADWVAAIGSSNPLHWYRLDEDGSNIAIDSGSAAQHGVYQNGVTQGLAGVTNGAAGFDGVNDAVNLDAASIAGAWTAEFIVSKQGQEDAGSLVRRDPPGGALRLDQWNNTGEVGFTAFGVADYLFNSNYSAPLDEFIHLTFVGDPLDGVTLFVNGEEEGSNPNFVPLHLFEIGGPDAANMILDELVVFDRALAQQEIFAHANAAGFVVPEPSAIALWSLIGLGLASFGYYRFGKNKQRLNLSDNTPSIPILQFGESQSDISRLDDSTL